MYSLNRETTFGIATVLNPQMTCSASAHHLLKAKLMEELAFSGKKKKQRTNSDLSHRKYGEWIPDLLALPF